MFRSALLLALAAPSIALAATWQVGPTRSYTHLQQLLDAVDLEPGDVVEVDGDATYPGGVIMRAEDGGSAGNPVTIRGLRVNGRRPHLDGGVNTIEFRQAHHVVFEGFEVTGGSSRCIFLVADDITVRDAEVHACPAMGILSADNDSGSFTLEYSEIHDAGDGTNRHPLYIQSDEIAFPGSVFRMQYNYVHDGNGGNLLKSRHERSEIYYNWFEGATYHELELIGPDQWEQQPGWTEDLVREDQDVVGNVIVHTNPDFGAVIRVGGDGSGQSKGRVRFANNTILVTGGSYATVLRIFEGIQAVEAHNNVLYAPNGATLRIERSVEAVWTDGRLIGGSNNWVPAGSDFLPPEWTGTIEGTNPGFSDVAQFDLRPAAGSALIDAGNPAPQPIPGYAVPDTLFPPAFQPQRAAVGPGAAQPRPVSGTIDIGAFERASDLIFADDFEG